MNQTIFNLLLLILFVFAIFSAILCANEFNRLNENIEKYGCKEICYKPCASIPNIPEMNKIQLYKYVNNSSNN